ncbi:MAG: hypothetical protein GY861_02755 [bacterium]|nr:hypothetical protein [bacterium]
MSFNDIFQTGGAAGGGTLLGAALAFLGMKNQITDIKENIKDLKTNVVYKDVFEQHSENIDLQFEHLKEGVDDIKDLIKKNGNGNCKCK